jgi:4-hydroxybenzoate polyprenyltransferase
VTENPKAKSNSDIPQDNWIVRYTPQWTHPFIRLARYDRPIGTWLLLFPCWWSIALSIETPDHLVLFLTFGLGAIIMRGAGCTYNDILDRRFDAKVARTMDRPLPSGKTTVKRAVYFLMFQLVVGLFILVTLNNFAWAVGAASLILVFTYPLMKRITFWPQFFLGLAFNWGALLGWAAVREDLNTPAYFLYCAGIFWTLGYDTIYAHQDRTDDPKAGVKSTARRFGLGSKPWVFSFYALSLTIFCFAGYAAGSSWPFYLGVAVGGAQLLWQIWDLELDNPRDCLSKFQSNKLFGWIVLTGILASNFTTILGK